MPKSPDTTQIMACLSPCHTQHHTAWRGTHSARTRHTHALADAPCSEHHATPRALPRLQHQSTLCCNATCKCNCNSAVSTATMLLSQHQLPILRTLALQLMRIHLSSHPPCGVRPYSKVPNFLLSSLLSIAFYMLLSFVCRLLLSGARGKPIRSSTPSFATSSPSAASASRASPPTTSRAPANQCTALGSLHNRSSPPSAPRIVHGTTPAGSRALPRDLGAVRAGGCTCRVAVHVTRSLVLPDHRRLTAAITRTFACRLSSVYVACLNLRSYMRYARSRPLP